MKTVAVFFAGVVTASVVGFVLVEGFIHFMEHTAYTEGGPLMGAAETIQAAIDKLERLRGNQGPWTMQGGNEWIHPIGVTVASDDGGVTSREADLIVILHRTIDAQLRVLKAGRTAFSPDYFPLDYSLPGWVAEARALALPLAEAIVGEVSR